jgi:hypothetical protein
VEGTSCKATTLCSWLRLYTEIQRLAEICMFHVAGRWESGGFWAQAAPDATSISAKETTTAATRLRRRCTHACPPMSIDRFATAGPRPLSVMVTGVL